MAGAAAVERHIDPEPAHTAFKQFAANLARLASRTDVAGGLLRSHRLAKGFWENG